jgi:hypothetical protein
MADGKKVKVSEELRKDIIKDKELNERILRDIAGNDLAQLEKDVKEDILLDERIKKELRDEMAQESKEAKSSEERIALLRSKEEELEQEIIIKGRQIEEAEREVAELSKRHADLEHEMVEEEKLEEMVEEDEIVDAEIKADEEFGSGRKPLPAVDKFEVQHDETGNIERKGRIMRKLKEEEEDIEE